MAGCEAEGEEIIEAWRRGQGGAGLSHWLGKPRAKD